MTVCVAGLCENGKLIVMAADKMIGMGYVEGEPDISKLRKLHKDWWILFAGEDVSPIFDIIDYSKAFLKQDHNIKGDDTAPLGAIIRSVEKAFEKKRIEEAERLYLKSIGWNLREFNKHGQAALQNAGQIQADIERYHFVLEALIAGFEHGDGFIFGIDGYGEKRGIARRWDVPGFAAIGSGSTVANFMLYYRLMSPKKGAREGLYYVLEAKFYGEQASGVGPSTDLYIARPGQDTTPINDQDIVEKKLIPICVALEPGDLGKKDIDVLNGLKELKGFKRIKIPKKKRKRKQMISTAFPIAASGMPFEKR